MLSINIIFPVLNEQLRIEKGIYRTVEYLRHNANYPFVLTIVDNGSTDNTALISHRLCREYKEVRYLKTDNKGVGVALEIGILNNEADIVGYMDVDLSTRLDHLNEMMSIFEKLPEVLIVNGSRLAPDSRVSKRKWYRMITSYGLTFILKLCLHMKTTDSICGFKFFRRQTALSLLEKCSDERGWFRVIEMLIRAEHMGIVIKDLPVVWEDDPNTTVKVFSLVSNYLRCIFKLRLSLKKEFGRV